MYRAESLVSFLRKHDVIKISLVPRPSPAPVFDRFQYAKTEPEGLVNLTHV